MPYTRPSIQTNRNNRKGTPLEGGARSSSSYSSSSSFSSSSSYSCSCSFSSSSCSISSCSSCSSSCSSSISSSEPSERYWRGGGNWTDAKWAYTAGGTPGEAPTPTSNEAVIFDAVSSDCTLTANANCTSITTEGYLATLDLNDFNLTVEGSGIFTGGTVFGGSGTLTLGNGNIGGIATFSSSCTFTCETSMVYCKKSTSFVGGGTIKFYNIKLTDTGITCAVLESNNGGFQWENQFTINGGTLTIGTNTTGHEMTWIGDAQTNPLVVVAGTTCTKTGVNPLWLNLSPQSLATELSINIPEITDVGAGIHLQFSYTDLFAGAWPSEWNVALTGNLNLYKLTFFSSNITSVGSVWCSTYGYNITIADDLLFVSDNLELWLDCEGAGGRTSTVTVYGDVLSAPINGYGIISQENSVWHLYGDIKVGTFYGYYYEGYGALYMHGTDKILQIGHEDQEVIGAPGDLVILGSTTTQHCYLYPHSLTVSAPLTFETTTYGDVVNDICGNFLMNLSGSLDASDTGIYIIFEGNIDNSADRPITVGVDTIFDLAYWESPVTVDFGVGTILSNLSVNGAISYKVSFVESFVVNGTFRLGAKQNIEFTSGKTFQADKLIWTGLVGNMLTITASSAAAWNLKVVTSTSILYTDVEWSDASSGIAIDATHVSNINGLNNTNWNFPPA